MSRCHFRCFRHSRRFIAVAGPLSASALAVSAWVAAVPAGAQTHPSAPQPFIEELRQQERERALRAQQERAVDARLPVEAPPAPGRLPEAETPCFRIDRVVLGGERAGEFQWLLAAAAGAQGDDAPIGRCLGTQGVDTVLARLQQALVERGWVTTRVLAPPQDLAGGTLAFTLVPGRIAAIRFAEGTRDRTALRNAIPEQPGDLLNLRDIEQGLENLKRLPTADTDIQIEPSRAAGAQPGDSDLVVKYASRFPLRGTLSLDDSGTRATGRTQAGATLAWDGPLGLNDLAYVSVNHDLFNPGARGTSGQTLHYSIPYGDWLLGATATRSSYHQSVAGLNQDYVYAGESRNAEVRLSRLLYRDQRRKTTLALRAFRRASFNFIDDTEIEVQRRVVGGWELGLNHREFLGAATLDANLQYRRGTGAFGARPAPEEFFGEGTSRFGLVAADASLNGTDLGEELKQGILTAFLNTAAAQGANWIGQNGPKGTEALNAYAAEAAHLIVGCAVGAARAGGSGGCAPGAIGAVIGHLTAQAVNPTGDPALADETLAASQLMAGVAGALASKDGQGVYIAAAAGWNAAENNWLSQKRPSLLTLSEQERYDAAVGACNAGDSRACMTREALAQTSLARDAALRDACANSADRTACGNQVQLAQNAGNKVFVDEKGNITLNGVGFPTAGPIASPFTTSTAGQIAQSTAEGGVLAAGVYSLGNVGAALYTKGVAAQTTVIGGGLASVGASQWATTAAVGAGISIGTTYLFNPDASFGNYAISGLAGAAGGVVKFSSNIAAGLANQWVPTGVNNLTTQLMGTSSAKIISLWGQHVAEPKKN